MIRAPRRAALCSSVIIRGLLVVGSRVLSDNENQIGVVKVFQWAGTIANSDRRRQPLAGGFVAEVGAVREVVRSKLSRKQLVKECGLVARPGRGIELHLPGIGQSAQFLSDYRESLIPLNSYIVIRIRVVP